MTTCAWRSVPDTLVRGVLLGLVTALLAAGSFAQSTGDESDESAKRPKIGLVLSGGGARGAAHVGVLKVLHELRIPIDLIAGNSMGALVGGNFAFGYSPDELQGNSGDG